MNVFQGSGYNLIWEQSSKQVADIFTKAFPDALKWRSASILINHLLKDEFPDLHDEPTVSTTSPSRGALQHQLQLKDKKVEVDVVVPSGLATGAPALGASDTAGALGSARTPGGAEVSRSLARKAPKGLPEIAQRAVPETQ